LDNNSSENESDNNSSKKELNDNNSKNKSDYYKRNENYNVI